MKATMYQQIANIEYYNRKILESLKKSDYTSAKYYHMLLSDTTIELGEVLERIEDNGEN